MQRSIRAKRMMLPGGESYKATDAAGRAEAYAKAEELISERLCNYADL